TATRPRSRCRRAAASPSSMRPPSPPSAAGPSSPSATMASRSPARSPCPSASIFRDDELERYQEPLGAAGVGFLVSQALAKDLRGLREEARAAGNLRRAVLEEGRDLGLVGLVAEADGDVGQKHQDLGRPAREQGVKVLFHECPSERPRRMPAGLGE